MEKKPEETTPQNPVVEETKTPEKTEEPKVEVQPEVPESISAEELTDLKKKAGVSSQNFERAKTAEEKVKTLEAQLQEQEVLPTVDVEGESELKSEVSDLKQRLNKADLLKRHPDMEEVWDKFEEFRSDPENKGMNMNTAAKAFRVENELDTPRRKGLEEQTGGNRVKISGNNKMSVDDAKKLRTTNYKKYREMLKKGQINVE